MLIRERPYMKREQAEEEAAKVLVDYARKCNGSLQPPIDVELIGDALFGLAWDWDIIEDPLASIPASVAPERKLILAGLYPRSRRVVMNEQYVDLYRAKPELERFTKGHEVGHWVLHINHSVLDHPTLFELDEEPDAREIILCRDGDDTWIERQANWFSAALLMPKQALIKAASGCDLRNWSARYQLAERFGVTISALGVRLSQLGLSYVDTDGGFHRSAAEAHGQQRLR